MPDPCVHLQEANHRRSVFLRVLFMFRRPKQFSLRRLHLTYNQRPFLAYYAVRCLLWEGYIHHIPLLNVRGTR